MKKFIPLSQLSLLSVARGMLFPLALLLSNSINAAALNPSSYELLNGERGGGTYTFFDDAYNGSGNPQLENDALSGGLGDLTDGVIATSNWTSQPDAYIGWVSIEPEITFNFDNIIELNTVSFYFDDSEFGGVDNPTGVTISNGINQQYLIIADPQGTGPFQVDFSNLSLVGSSFDITVHHADNQWVMLSEVEFDGVDNVPPPAAVSAPSILGIFLTGLLSIFGYRQYLG